MHVDRKFPILVGHIEPRFHLLNHDPTGAVHYVWAMDVCRYFIHIVPLEMENIVALAGNNLGSERGGHLIQSLG